MRRGTVKYKKQAKELLEQMTLEEKVYLMSGHVTFEEIKQAKRQGYHFNYWPFPAGGNERLDIEKLQYCDGPRGCVCGVGKTTCFPVPMLRGATFDTALEEKIGQAIGREVRANGGNFFGGICVNLPYHPGWGRSQEVYGEDSFALGAFGSATVRGLRKENVIPCIKHYAFNSVEDNRFEVDMDCSKRTEREVFLPHFKDCIDAGAGAVMTAYNKFRGELCGQSEYLMNDILRKEWGFEGIALGDFFWGISDTEKAINAGVDLEMSCAKFYGKKLAEAVKNGKIEEEKVNESALRILTLMCEWKAKEAKSRKVYDEKLPGCKEHLKLAYKAAAEGITLIKNEKQVLPLGKNLYKIAVIGKLASEENTGDIGSSRMYPAHVATILEGIVKKVPETAVVYYGGNKLEHIRRLAAEADAVIYVVGMDYHDEGEFNPMRECEIYNAPTGGDRKTLKLHQEETTMLQQTGEINPASVAVVMGGNTITISEWEGKIPAILYAYYPGQEGGTALADILFGKISPSGKLPFVIPYDEKDLQEIDWKASRQYYGYYHGYQYLDAKGIKPYRSYGYGMSYTSFKVTNAVVEADARGITASVDVENTGKIRGAEVIQLYIGKDISDEIYPVKALKQFKRIILRPGEKKRTELFCPMEKIMVYDEEKEKFILKQGTYHVYIGTSSADEDLHKEIIELQ